jgi:hypothetical protein
MPSRRATPDHDSSLPCRPSAHPRCGLAYPLPRLSAVGGLTSLACAGPPMPAADFCEVVRGDDSPLSPPRGPPAALPRSAGRPSVHRRRSDQVRPCCGWRTWWSRAHSSQAYPTSSPVRVPRPAPAFHAAFSPHLTVTPWRFPCPSAPRTPGQETFTPEHDSMHGTHARDHRHRGAVQRRFCPPPTALPGVRCKRLILIEAPSSAYHGGMLILGKITL